MKYCRLTIYKYNKVYGKGWETAGVDGAVSARMSVVGHFILSCQKATAAAALTLSESTP